MNIPLTTASADKKERNVEHLVILYILKKSATKGMVKE